MTWMELDIHGAGIDATEYAVYIAYFGHMSQVEPDRGWLHSPLLQAIPNAEPEQASTSASLASGCWLATIDVRDLYPTHHDST